MDRNDGKYEKLREAALHSLVNHLTKVEGLVGELCPTTVKDNLKDGTHEPSSRLRIQNKRVNFNNTTGT